MDNVGTTEHGLLYWSAFNVRHARRVFGIWRGMMNYGWYEGEYEMREI